MYLIWKTPQVGRGKEPLGGGTNRGDLPACGGHEGFGLRPFPFPCGGLITSIEQMPSCWRRMVNCRTKDLSSKLGGPLHVKCHG